MSNMLAEHQLGPELQEWYRTWLMEDKWQNGFMRLEQVLFVRDNVMSQLFHDVEGAECTVVSMHTSKSVRLPVYSIYLPVPKQMGGGRIEIRARCNWHDWKLSVVGLFNRMDFKDIKETFKDLFDPKESYMISPVYFEGFSEEWVFPALGSVGLGHGGFSCELHNEFEVWTFLWLLKNMVFKETA